jgi:tetratricopeptide (TPR) repeat protein
VIAVDTEDPVKGETLLDDAVAWLGGRLDGPPECVHAFIDSCNHLAIIWTNRSEPTKALPHLEKAMAAYEDIDPKDVHAKTPDIEQAFTKTIFYLAQVYGNLGRDEESANMCAACLRRQCETKESEGGIGRGGKASVSPEEWAQNAAQLSGFYAARACWATARHCVAAAEKVFTMAVPDWRKAHGPFDSKSSSQKPDLSVAKTIDESPADIGANVQLAWGKLHLMRLTAAKELFLSKGECERGIGGEAKKTAASGDDNRLIVEFPKLRLDDGTSTSASKAAKSVGIVSEGPGEGWVPRDVAGVRIVFNQAAPRYRAALSRYVLDGFVTEHCDVVLDVSSLHKCLAFFEDGNPRRYNSIQRRRVTRVESVAKELSFDKYPGLYKALWFEYAEAHRAVLEGKITRNRPPLSLGEAARCATRGYSAYIDTFKDQVGPNRAAPRRIHDEEEERTYVTARFIRARTASKQHGQFGSEADALGVALVDYEFVPAYCEAHGLEGMEQESGLCAQMCQLLPSKIVHLRSMEKHAGTDPLVEVQR